MFGPVDYLNVYVGFDVILWLCLILCFPFVAGLFIVLFLMLVLV